MYNELIDIDTDGNVFLHDDSIALIPELFAVYKNKHMGSKMVKYIVSVYDYKSPLRRLPLGERRSRVSYIIYGKQKAIDESKIKDAIDEYLKLQFDPLIDEYNAMCEQSYKMTKVFLSIEPTAENLEDLNKLQTEMGKAAKSRDAHKELIKKDSESDTKIQGTGSEDFSLLEQDLMLGGPE